MVNLIIKMMIKYLIWTEVSNKNRIHKLIFVVLLVNKAKLLKQIKIIKSIIST